MGITGLLCCVALCWIARILFNSPIPPGPLWFYSKVEHSALAIILLLVALIMGVSGLAFLAMAIIDPR